MKKAILLAALTVGLSASVFAQGTIKFANGVQNTNTTPATPYNTDLVRTNDLQGHTGLAASTFFHVALYWGITGSTEAQLVVIAATGTGTTSVGGLSPALPGRFSGGTALWVTGNGTPPSGDAVFQVRGWSGNFASYEAAYAAGTGYIGVSTMFSAHTGGAGSPPETPASTLGTAFTGLTISPVPEPSTIALGGLGAAALLLFRRRK
ncbi:MAG: hypothetical protein JWQ71_1689 [Pedosphaera sp.]|nr:hypothetical protein [Pedosphaera sp.]